PLTPGTARLYVCGITPYDATHLGHANTYHAADLMHRALRDTGLEVEVAQNITDVDDPLFERARRDGIDWEELATSQVELFTEDMAALRIIDPQTYRSVSAANDSILTVVQSLGPAGVSAPPRPTAPGATPSTPPSRSARRCISPAAPTPSRPLTPPAPTGTSIWGWTGPWATSPATANSR